jgi:putative RecB family exonuclease
MRVIVPPGPAVAATRAAPMLQPAAPRRRRMPTLYSHSRLSSFENCKKKFYFRYVQALPQETEGIEAFVGKRVHEILERLYQFVEQEQVPSLPRVLQRYHALFDEHHDPARVKIIKEGMTLEHYRDLGARCIENHYRRHYPFDDGETLGIEQRVVFDLDAERRYSIQGIIDRVVRTRDGVIEIQDYKTGSYVPSQKKLDVDRQLALYQIGVARQLETDEPIRLVWHYLARDRTCTSTRTPEQLEALQRETVELIDRIQAETDFPAQKNNLCPWCEYRDICPAFGHTPPPSREAASVESTAGAAQLNLL